ncbi:MAG: Trk family potassium uptake protein [Clostridiales bacterium]|nr:Trk family potassium uptake protein [Clostridiales bacterium]
MTNVSGNNKKRLHMRPMLVVLLGFLVVMFVGAFILALPVSNTDGKWLPFTHAVFWAMNGVCGTGLVVRSTALGFSGFGQAILLVLIQFGGLGFMTIATFVFIIIRKRITLKDRIAIQEALGQDQIKGVVRLVRNIIIMTLLIELVGAAALTPFFCVRNGAIGVWQALFTSISAFCNAGFDVLGRPGNEYGSLTDYNGNAGILLIVALIAILGSFGFPVIDDILRCKFRYKRYRLHTKVVLIVSLSIMTFGTFFFLVSEFNSGATAGMNGGEKLLNSMFQSVTASSTAGYSSLDQTKLSASGMVMSAVIMFIGSSPCSTGGGIKTTTFAVLLFMGWSGLRGKEEIVVGKNSISFKTGFRAVAVLMLGSMLILTGVMIIGATDNISPVGYMLYDTVSAFTTTGLSMGIVPNLSNAALYVLAVVMFIGRLGPLSIGMMFGSQDRSGIKFPNANIMIG